jgi:uncharacterized membrane protein
VTTDVHQQTGALRAKGWPPGPAKGRIGAIDAARGLALVAMAVYHFTWDLELFGYILPGTTATGGWRLFARCIASSFLFLVGVSLVLAHGRGVKWRPFLNRLAQIVAAALLISLVTWHAVPDSMIFFGILHEIALASVLGLAFLRLPPLSTLIIAGAVIAAPFYLRSPLYDTPALWWVGLSTTDPRSNDYVPVLPWFGAVLIGIAAARFAQSRDLFDRLARWEIRPARPLEFIGRHSLLVYLVHQPILIGIVWCLAQVFPPPAVPAEIQFGNACRAQCRTVRDEAFCADYCECMLYNIEAAGLTDAALGNGASDEIAGRLRGLASACTAQTEFEMEAEP